MKILHTSSIKGKAMLLLIMAAALLSAADESVKVSDFKPDRANATAAVQKAVDSGSKQVIFDNPFPWSGHAGSGKTGNTKFIHLRQGCGGQAR